jgi:Protein of unknown function (DUF2914)
MTYKPIQVIVNKIMIPEWKKRELKCGSGFVIVNESPGFEFCFVQRPGWDPTSMRKKALLFFFAFLSCSILLGAKGFCQKASLASSAPGTEKLTLVQAAMCPGLKEGSPCNPGVVFSVNEGRVSCFSSFDPVPRKTFIYHSWFYKGVLMTRQKLTLNPPRWSTYSTIQLREADKGPWRVEIADQDGGILEILRFSITD